MMTVSGTGLGVSGKYRYESTFMEIYAWFTSLSRFLLLNIQHRNWHTKHPQNILTELNDNGVSRMKEWDLLAPIFSISKAVVY